jgi:hypothetical protein
MRHSHATHDLYNAIDRGDFPEWSMRRRYGRSCTYLTLVSRGAVLYTTVVSCGAVLTQYLPHNCQAVALCACHAPSVHACSFFRVCMPTDALARPGACRSGCYAWTLP